MTDQFTQKKQVCTCFFLIFKKELKRESYRLNRIPPEILGLR